MFITVRLKRILVLLGIVLFVLSVLATVFVRNSICTNAQPTEVQLPIVMYHGLMKNVKYQNQYMIDPKYFEEDLKYLNGHGYHTIFPSELMDYFYHGKALPDKPIMLMFDDGYYNNYVYAYPLLKKYHCKATISPIGVTVDTAESEQNKSPIYSQCGWKELKEMAESGLVEIQNHTYALHQIKNGLQGVDRQSNENTADYQKRLRTDLETANREIEEHIGAKPSAFVYPFGSKNETALEVIRSMGFGAVFDCEEKPNLLHTKEDLYALHRYLRPNHLSSNDFFTNTHINSQ